LSFTSCCTAPAFSTSMIRAGPDSAIIVVPLSSR
jgi:hypothetical protein